MECKECGRSLFDRAEHESGMCNACLDYAANRRLAELEAFVEAVVKMISDAGCDCDCDCLNEEPWHSDDCEDDRCWPCRLEAAHKASFSAALGGSAP